MSPTKHFSYEPEHVSDDLYCIPLPLYDGSPVNSYVAIGEDGVRLIDGGLGTEECQAKLFDGLTTLGFSKADVLGLVITHGHNDHVGAAQTVLANGGEVLAHRIESTDGRRLAFDEAWLERNGLPVNGQVRDRWRPFEWPQPTRLLEDGDRLKSGPATAYQVLSAEHGLRDRRPVAERYALSQLLARLRHLERKNEVARLDDGDPIRYALC